MMLESIKNAMVGKVHYPHSHFISYGAHSASLKFYQDSKVKSLSEKEKFNKAIELSERLIRTYD